MSNNACRHDKGFVLVRASSFGNRTKNIVPCFDHRPRILHSLLPRHGIRTTTVDHNGTCFTAVACNHLFRHHYRRSAERVQRETRRRGCLVWRVREYNGDIWFGIWVRRRRRLHPNVHPGEEVTSRKGRVWDGFVQM